jgi:hypothetical protein
MISGSRDDQTSADAWNAAKRQAGGALTMALTQSITPTITWKNLVTAIRKYMTKNGFTQYPLLSVSNQLLGDKVFDL